MPTPTTAPASEPLAAPRLGDRSLFPDLACAAYLNHAASSPASLRVKQGVEAVLRASAREGAGAVATALATRDRLRHAAARLVGARPEDLALTANTSAGVIDVALCFPWKKGDRVLVFEGEFPANVTPWQQAARLFELEVAFCPLRPFEAGDGPGLERLEQELQRGVRLVAVSAVQFRSGLRMPLQAISWACARHGAELFVDGVQACGAVPIDVAAMGIDYLACGSHKWLMGMEGAGFLYVRPERVGALRPHTAGWLSVEDPVSFLIQGAGRLRYDRPVRKSASLFEVGTACATAHAALEAALGPILELGVERIHAHANAYLDRLEPQLVERGFRSLRAAEPERRSAILSVEVPAGIDVIALRGRLSAQGVATATPDGALRFAPHWPNALGEIDAVLAAIDAALAG